ncbi:30S ribosomal protein S18 [Candidatus Fermentibacterales bacterium]|nr:30S ribosomal protein S18 [Candidatus Fermentibacterales bacterium]
MARKKKRGGAKVPKKKKCRFCATTDLRIDYKNDRLLSRFVSDRGKIVPRRVSGNCARHQRRVAAAIKVARFLAILPYVREHYR